MHHHNKEAELRRATIWPVLLLLLATITFFATLFLPHFWPTESIWLKALKAVSEASMVGALADWFAVSALFHHIPLPLIGRHTAVVRNNKDRIASNLAAFVQDKFLHKSSLLALIQRHDPAKLAAEWLSSPEHSRRLCRHILDLLSGFLDMTNDAAIARAIRQMMHRAIDNLDIAQAVALIIEGLIRDNRHQAVLDDGLKQILRLINRPATHQFIAREITAWLKRDHPWKTKILPDVWLSKKSAAIAASAVASVLTHIEQDRRHLLRRAFIHSLSRFIKRLHNDSATQGYVEQIRHYLKTDQTLNHYCYQLWHELRAWLKQDLARQTPEMHIQLCMLLQWLGRMLHADSALRKSLNHFLQVAVAHSAPEFAMFLTRHISDTMKGWDADDMAHQVELNIGRDLQYIRINGTLVGGVIGLILFLISTYLPQMFWQIS